MLARIVGEIEREKNKLVGEAPAKGRKYLPTLVGSHCVVADFSYKSHLVVLTIPNHECRKTDV